MKNQPIQRYKTNILNSKNVKKKMKKTKKLNLTAYGRILRIVGCKPFKLKLVSMKIILCSSSLFQKILIISPHVKHVFVVNAGLLINDVHIYLIYFAIKQIKN